MDPNQVLSAVEALGLEPTGELLQLNSYENRVYEIRLEKNQRVIAKFYRPGRWTKECILEEHAFLFELAAADVPVVTPNIIQNSSLFLHEGIWCALFPKFYGKMPEEFVGEDLKQVGRRLAQIHNIGSQKRFQHRPILGEIPFSPDENLEFLKSYVAPELWFRYRQAGEELLDLLQDTVDGHSFLRIHGDCHRGNLLYSPGAERREFFFVDFDDCLMGPAVQDFWMLFSELNDPQEREQILTGYEEFRDFPHEQWAWIPLLRGLRVLNYAAWIARRWEDPSFPKLFPDFGSFNYWAEETEALESAIRQL